MTQFEKIKNMSIEEMVDMFFKNTRTCDFCIRKDSAGCVGVNCKEGIKKYLESEVLK